MEEEMMFNKNKLWCKKKQNKKKKKSEKEIENREIVFIKFSSFSFYFYYFAFCSTIFDEQDADNEPVLYLICAMCCCVNDAAVSFR